MSLIKSLCPHFLYFTRMHIWCCSLLYVIMGIKLVWVFLWWSLLYIIMENKLSKTLMGGGGEGEGKGKGKSKLINDRLTIKGGGGKGQGKDELMNDQLAYIAGGGKGQGQSELINDWMIELPDDVLGSIMSFLSFKEAAVTSLVSHKWNKRLWRTFRLLNFEDARAIDRVKDDCRLIDQERSAFVRWVNYVLEGHEGETIDEFRVSFDLDFSSQPYVDEWVGSALDKQVKKLHLDLQRNVFVCFACCSLPLKCCRSLEQNLPGSKHPLTSLRLKNVDVTTQVMDCFLHSCPYLEDLHIENSESLEIIRVSGASLPLKHLTVYSCENMKIIDISVPKLLSFKYCSSKIKELHCRDVPSQLKELHIRDASSLKQILFLCGVETLSPNLGSLSSYFLQLEHLSLTIYSSVEFRSGVNRIDAFSRLKHLELTVVGPQNESVLGWTTLIEASPILEKLTLKMVCRRFVKSIWRPVKSRYPGRPLKNLKTLEIYDLFGSPLELELVYYVLENAIKLEEVIVHVDFSVKHTDTLLSALQVEEKSPNGARLIYNGRRFDEVLR